LVLYSAIHSGSHKGREREAQEGWITKGKMMEIKYGRKRSGIKRELTKKVEDWLLSIDDLELQTAARKDVIVTGGSIASMLLGEPVNDFDIYFRTKETTLLIAKYYVAKFNGANNLKTADGVNDCAPIVIEETKENCKGVKEDRVLIRIQSAGVAAEDQSEYSYFEMRSEEETVEYAESLIADTANPDKPKYRPVFMSENAITLSHKMQLIVRFYGSPTEIHDNYDFVHAMCYWDHAEKSLQLPADALEALLSRTLIYKGSLYPVASIFRCKKFIERGWRITAGQQLKIMWQISELDLRDFDVLQEQLTGVDMAYMWQLIEALKSVDPEKINAAYVSAIIDRVFD
jgi:hypothetical protein